MAPKLQPHPVFDPNLPVPVTADEALNILVTDSVKNSSQKTYASALNTISKFLKVQRSCDDDQEPATTTREEFSLFLCSLKEQNVASANTFRSALVWEQRRCKREIFAIEKTFVKAATGASSGVVSSCKGVITPAMLEDLGGKTLEAVSHFVPTCNLCLMFDPRLSQPWFFNMILLKWISFQYWGRLRPGEIELLHINDLFASMHENTQGEMVEVNFLNFRVPRKNDDKPFRLDVLALNLFRSLAGPRSGEEGYLAPRCADKHIGAHGSELLHWHTGLVWVAHSLRHGVFTTLTNAVQAAVNEFVTGVTNSTLNGTYIVPMAQRVRSVEDQARLADARAKLRSDAVEVPDEAQETQELTQDSIKAIKAPRLE